MTLDGSFGIVIAIGVFSWLLIYWGNRDAGPPQYPMRVHRYVAAFAGSRTTWVDCKSFALQVSGFGVPFLYILLAWRLDLDSLSSTMALALIMALMLQMVFRFYARRRLLAAEYLMLGFRVLVEAKGSNPMKYEPVCQHCGYQEYVCSYATMQISELPEDDHSRLAYSNSGPLVPVVSRKMADALRASDATGLILVPVGGNEPVEWYGLRSNHILPPMLDNLKSQSALPYRTQQCERNHGIEPVPRVLRSEVCYNRSTFDALDFNYSYELSGSRNRRGKRFIVISQRMFRLLAKIDTNMQWNCQPVRFVN